MEKTDENENESQPCDCDLLRASKIQSDPSDLIGITVRGEWKLPFPPTP